ncbi:hypothetical protein KI811_04375 [Geobacter hydrogenophilus]|uniref:Uncharacterized protein n=1 Tax=Geobacter hydrogenophilus TaxID=40983 RepID=A0A9W6LE38_9BACT|nr:hypothetical protein [Geobacter hydrogenophilus]MBT0893055.1 hypothetical protein [Geobacter hydrogenophilus]GLI39106.1 hypothetical protein GHYDROH2_26070 [Geobacter hydrogenophilus]
MRDSDQLPRYYLGTALQAMEKAYALNHDATVGQNISQAIAALHQLMHQTAASHVANDKAPYDPYEVNEHNSAI